jgi:hypothetical protein
MKKKSLPSTEYLKEIFDYEDGWLIRKQGKSGVPAGKAGTVTTRGYVQLRIDGQIYWGHRLIWAWHYGDPGDLYIDHVDRDKTNNRIENLKLVTFSENCYNRTEEQVTCPHCLKVGAKRQMTRYHFDNCQKLKAE